MKDTYNFVDEDMVLHDILGVYGYVAPDPATDGQSNHIVSLGFLENTCPAHGILDLKYMHKTTYMEAVAKEVGESTLVVAILSIFIAAVALCGLYLLLINRGKLCKSIRGDETDNSAASDNVQLGAREQQNQSV